jgi:hypothetical protein
MPEALRYVRGSKTLFGRYGEKFTNPRKQMVYAEELT